jgi:general secretion pathway protein I
VNGAGRARGFTLIEVLVALIIVAFGMGAVMSALTSAADSIIRLREKTFAEWVGFNQLAATRLKALLPVTGSSDGDVDIANSRWHWQQRVEDMDVPGLKRITIQVRLAAAGDAAPTNAGKGTAGEAWLATVVGFRGDAIQSPLDVIANWDGGATAPPASKPAGAAGN